MTADRYVDSTSATGGVNPKLHAPLSDSFADDRFPGLRDDHPSKFSTRDASILLGLFVRHLVPTYTDLSITQERLLAIVFTPHVHRFTSLTRESIVSCLLHLGLLLFKSADSFFFSPPGIARLIGAVRNGRKEVRAIIHRRQYDEMPLRELLQVRQLKTSPCLVPFHLREMLGSEESVELIDATIGPVVKLRSKNK